MRHTSLKMTVTNLLRVDIRSKEQLVPVWSLVSQFYKRPSHLCQFYIAPGHLYHSFIKKLVTCVHGFIMELVTAPVILYMTINNFTSVGKFESA